MVLSRHNALVRLDRFAFTLLELLIVFVIVAILGTMLLPVYAGMRKRAQRVQCTANLHALYVGVDLYLQRNGSWPQIAPTSKDYIGIDFANAWIEALAPFGPTGQTWICPTKQELLGNPDYSRTANVRLDYIPMNFDDNPTSPFKWARQPWFIEVANVHGNGSLLIFPDGSVAAMGELPFAVAQKSCLRRPARLMLGANFPL